MWVRNVFYFSKKVLFSQNDVLFLFYFLINPTMTTVCVAQYNMAYQFVLQDVRGHRL